MLFLNQCNDTRKANRDAESALQSIANEVAFNGRSLALRIRYLESLFAEADSLQREGRTWTPEEWIRSDCTPALQLRTSGYDLAKVSGSIRYFEFATAEFIALVYSIQDHVNAFPSACAFGTVGLGASYFRSWVSDRLGSLQDLGKSCSQLEAIRPAPNVTLSIE